MVPIENTLAGSIIKNYDLLLEHDVTIVGEVVLRVVHNLIGCPGAELGDIRRVYSHPVALAQCERFLREHPELEAVVAYDTAGSVKMIMEAGQPRRGGHRRRKRGPGLGRRRSWPPGSRATRRTSPVSSS